MQQRMDLTGGVLPSWLKYRQDYGFVIYDLGDVLKNAYQNSGPVLLMLARKGISKLDANPDRQVPDEILFAMNPDTILGFSLARLWLAVIQPRWNVQSISATFGRC